MKLGIYYDVPMSEYKEWPGVHKSMFHHILRSGKALKHHIDHGEEQSKIMKFGNIVDTLLLEPNLFKERYIIHPDTYTAIVKKVEVQKPWNWNANACQEWRDENEVGDIEVVSKEDIIRARDIVEAIKTHPEAGRWVATARTQVSLCWTDPETDLPCKGRIDALPEDFSRIIDLKVTDDPLPGSFSRIVNNFLYHAGGAFYHDGFFLAQGKDPGPGPQIPFSFIAAEADEPHDVVTYNLGPESFDVGRIVYRDALARFKEYQDTGEYPGYSNVTEEVEIPRWAIDRVQQEGII